MPFGGTQYRNVDGRYAEIEDGVVVGTHKEDIAGNVAALVFATERLNVVRLGVTVAVRQLDRVPTNLALEVV